MCVGGAEAATVRYKGGGVFSSSYLSCSTHTFAAIVADACVTKHRRSPLLLDPMVEQVRQLSSLALLNERTFEEVLA